MGPTVTMNCSRFGLRVVKRSACLRFYLRVYIPSFGASRNLRTTIEWASLPTEARLAVLQRG